MPLYTIKEIADFYRQQKIVEGAVDQSTGKVRIKSRRRPPENSESLMAMIERIPFQDRCKIIRSLKRHCRRLGFPATNFLWWDIVASQNILLFTIYLNENSSVQIALYWKRVKKGGSVLQGFITTGPTWEWDPRLQNWRYAIEATYYREALNLLISALEKKTHTSIYRPPIAEKGRRPAITLAAV